MRKYLHLFGYAVYLGCTFLARFFPLPLIFVLGKCMGLIGYFLLRSRRKLAVSNLRIALELNESEAQILARQHFMNLGANLLSMLKIATLSDARLWQYVTFEIAPQISRASTAQGCVAVLSHMSNWELLSRLAKLFPHHNFGAIYQKLANGHVNQHFNKSRAGLGVTLFDRREGFWDAVAFVESGGVLGVLTDQYAGVSGTWMPFYGRLTSTSTLAAALAQRAGVELVPVIINTTGLARWHVTIGNPLERGNTPESATTAINRELEKQIAAAPADWLWSHDRWKTPRFGFLLSASNRRIFFPPAFNRAKVMPYRILIRSVDDSAEAKLTIPAVQAIKHGRPDVHVSIIASHSLAVLWQGVAEVDAVIAFSADETLIGVAKKIAGSGRYDVGILFPGTLRAAVEMFLAGVPYRLGPPGWCFLSFWRNPPGQPDPPLRGTERYRSILKAAGAEMEANGFPCEPGSPRALSETNTL